MNTLTLKTGWFTLLIGTLLRSRPRAPARPPAKRSPYVRIAGLK